MHEELIKSRYESCTIMGHTLKMQRMAAGISQRLLADILRDRIKSDYVIFNGGPIQCKRSAIQKMEDNFEFSTDFTTGIALKKILESGKLNESVQD